MKKNLKALFLLLAILTVVSCGNLNSSNPAVEKEPEQPAATGTSSIYIPLDWGTNRAVSAGDIDQYVVFVCDIYSGEPYQWDQARQGKTGVYFSDIPVGKCTVALYAFRRPSQDQDQTELEAIKTTLRDYLFGEDYFTELEDFEYLELCGPIGAYGYDTIQVIEDHTTEVDIYFNEIVENDFICKAGDDILFIKPELRERMYQGPHDGGEHQNYEFPENTENPDTPEPEFGEEVVVTTREGGTTVPATVEIGEPEVVPAENPEDPNEAVRVPRPALYDPEVEDEVDYTIYAMEDDTKLYFIGWSKDRAFPVLTDDNIATYQDQIDNTTILSPGTQIYPTDYTKYYAVWADEASVITVTYVDDFTESTENRYYLPGSEGIALMPGVYDIFNVDVFRPDNYRNIWSDAGVYWTINGDPSTAKGTGDAFMFGDEKSYELIGTVKAPGYSLNNSLSVIDEGEDSIHLVYIWFTDYEMESFNMSDLPDPDDLSDENFSSFSPSGGFAFDHWAFYMGDGAYSPDTDVSYGLPGTVPEISIVWRELE